MRLASLGIALVVALLCDASLAHGQRATERFIPIGQSPGISGRLSTQGTIVGVDPGQRRIAIETPTGRVSVRVEDSTRIWIDRHDRGEGVLSGSFDDLCEGCSAEVKYADPETREVAEWVKVRPPAPSP